MVRKIAGTLILAFMSLNLAGAAEDQAGESSSSSGSGLVQKVEKAVKRGADATVKGVKRGAEATANGIQRGGKAAAHGVKRGVEATEHAVSRTADKIHGISGSSSAATETGK